MKWKGLLLVILLFIGCGAQKEKTTIAAASDLKFAMEEIATSYRAKNPTDEIEIVYGSSGKFHTQIQQGAPYDLFFSADIAYPRMLAKDGLSATEVKPYAVGRIVLWSSTMDASKMTLADLTDSSIKKIAIANPKHAPYGKRAMEALESLGLREKIEPKLVYGENISHTAQMVQSGNAQVGIIALALAVNPELSKQGGYSLIPDNLHEPLEQGFILTKRGGENGAARRFYQFMETPETRAIMKNYGFILPGE